MQIPRIQFIRGIMMGCWLAQPEQPVSFFDPPERTEYHKPPEGVDYSDNNTPFGAILRGQIPARILKENDSLLAFRDIHPRAPLHALVIPKRRITSVFDLTTDDLPLLKQMIDMAYEVVEDYSKLRPNVNLNQDNVRLVFHVPPFNSVDHLHLHVLAPVSEMNCIFSWIKYNENVRWSTSVDRVVSRLQRGESPVPYRRPDEKGSFASFSLRANQAPERSS